MSRIKLKELLSLTEQAPQPPPTPAPTGQPPSAAPETPEAVPATPDAPTDTPAPEDPGEYDFTKDFKTFESSVEKAKQVAKKKFLDRMNQFVKDKKVTVNASRGYGQPQKDYTIEKVSKASVDWYYNKNVVVLTDENGKEYFLTPGVNIKIEQAAPAEPEAPQEPPKEKAPGQPPAGAPAPGGKQEPGQPPAGQPPAGQPGQPEPATPKAEPAPEQPAAGQPAPEEDPMAAKKKKKVPGAGAPPVAEETLEEDTGDKPYDKELVNRDFGPTFREIIPLRPGQSTIDLRPFFKGGTTSGDAESWYTEATFEIPVNMMGAGFNPKEFELDYKSEARTYGGPGQPFSRGSVHVTRRGRFYVFEFYDSGGLDI